MLRKQAERLCKKMSIGLESNLRPGKHLSYDHPSMENVRTWVGLQLQSGSIDGRLLGNFDQVWSMQWRPRKQTLQRKGGPEGRDMIARSQHLRSMRHCIERFLEMPLTETMSSEGVPAQVQPPLVRGQQASNIPVENFRQPRTLTTLSWSDGSLGARIRHM